MSDEKEEPFNWQDSKSIVVKPTQGVAVYTNPHGDVVILQEHDGYMFDRDPFIVVPRDRVEALIEALKKETED